MTPLISATSTHWSWSRNLCLCRRPRTRCGWRPSTWLMTSTSRTTRGRVAMNVSTHRKLKMWCLRRTLCAPSRPSHGSRGTRRCSTRWPRRTSTLSSIGSSKGETVTLHGATRRTGSPSSRRPRSPKRSTTMLNHTWIKGRFTVALKTKLNSKKKIF